MIKARKGRGKLLKKADSYFSIKFFPYYVGNIFIAFYVLTFVCMILFTVLFLPFFWNYLREYIHLVTALVLDYILLYLFHCLTMDGNLIKRRKILITVEFFYFFTGIASQLVKGVLRITIGLLGNIFSIFRVDHPIIKDNILYLDTAYNVFSGLVMMYHTNKNPIVITFLSVLIGSKRLRGVSHSLSEQIDFESSNVYSKKVNLYGNIKLIRKFQLWVFLARNPSLIRYRANDKNDKRIFMTYFDFIDGENAPKIPLGMSKALFEDEIFPKIPFGTSRMNLTQIKASQFKKETESDISLDDSEDDKENKRPFN